jgi:hypothetical protein
VQVLLGKRKRASDSRPDYFHLYDINGVKFGLHAEFDERPTHEDAEQRMTDIADESGCGAGNVYAVRIQGDMYTDDAVCVRRTINKHHTYYELTNKGWQVVRDTAAAVEQRLQWIKSGLAPDDSAGRTRKLYINYDNVKA